MFCHPGRRILIFVVAAALVLVWLACHDTGKTESQTWIAPATEAEKKIPFEDLSMHALKGKELYQLHCSSCHGENGFGDGPAGGTDEIPPANLHSGKVIQQSDGALFWKLSSGRGMMPGFRESLSDEQRWQIIAFIRQLRSAEYARSTPKILRGNLNIEQFLTTGPETNRLVFHKNSGSVIYTTFGGDVFVIADSAGRPNALKILDKEKHHINRLQGAAIAGNNLFLAGNVDLENKKGTSGRMVKYILPENFRDFIFDSTRLELVMKTVVYGSNKTIYDHGWNAIEVSPDGKYLYVNSGARTDHGEVQDNDGAYPNARENALTAKIFRFPAGAKNLLLPDDAEWLRLQGFIFAEGIRNAYDMAFRKDELFAVVNSSDYDHPEDMFWIREGHHYGFPWIMGGIENPQQFPGWNPDPATDKFISKTAHSWQMKYFRNDSSFPKPPEGVRFTPGVQNIGPDANEYRGHSGRVLDGDHTGVAVSTFTPHCSPLGLLFDSEKQLPGEFKGDGFVIRNNYGGRSGMMRPFTRQGADLLQLNMRFDSTTKNYVVRTERLADGFLEPADALLVGNDLYVLEFGGQKGSIWKIHFTGNETMLKKPGKKII
ncbi:c-type cytochrome [Pollutibacter soli]|uniref:c-type cytochrome n=1 Tax=Pollutibacter soli TaxID=3034157 RepID=UPI003013D450